MHALAPRPMRRRRAGTPIAAAIVAQLPAFAATARCLVDQGYALVPGTTPLLQPNGGVTLRLVYRRRLDEGVVVIEQPLTGAMPAALQDALALSFGF